MKALLLQNNYKQKSTKYFTKKIFYDIILISFLRGVHMKTIRNIILVLLFGAIVSFCLYIAPNYKKSENENKTNLVINYTNVTGKMRGKIIIEDEKNIYLSLDDIKNYYDKYIYNDLKYNYIIATANGKIACFDISNQTLTINDQTQNCKIIHQDETYYIPITALENVYNIDVKYIQNYDTVLIESLDNELKVATTNKKVNLKSKNTELSRTNEKISNNTKVSIVPNEEKKDYNGWTLVRTENGRIGYIKNENLGDISIERQKEIKEKKQISLAWEYFSKVGKAPNNNSSVKYDGVNVVSPSFFYIEDSSVKENVGIDGINYINWAKNNNYEVWAMVQNNNDSKDKKNEFSSWINDYKKREEIIKQIVNYARGYNLNGINIDFENIYKSDKESLSRFIIELKPRLENIGVTLSVDVTEPDGSDSWSLCFDRNVIGDISDYIVFMAYDQYGGSSKNAGSTASYDWVEKNINKFINREEVSADKIILGIPFYTRLWKEKDSEVTSIVIAMKNESKYIKSDVVWLEDAKQNYMEYAEKGITYKMWIEDEESIKHKLDLIKKYNLTGAAFWQKGYENDDIWSIVKSKMLE